MDDLNQLATWRLAQNETFLYGWHPAQKLWILRFLRAQERNSCFDDILPIVALLEDSFLVPLGETRAYEAKFLQSLSRWEPLAGVLCSPRTERSPL